MASQIFEPNVYNIVVIQPKVVRETCRQKDILGAENESKNVANCLIGQDRLVFQDSNCRDPNSAYGTCKSNSDITWSTKFKVKELLWKRIEPSDFKPLYGMQKLT